MRRETLGNVMWRFALVAVPALLMLAVLNALPQFVGGESLTVVRYDDVEQLQDRLGLTPWRPSALPAPWSWPPSRGRFAAGDPDWVQFVFDAAGDNGQLVFCQTVQTPRSGAAGLLRRAAVALRRPLTRNSPVPETLIPGGELLQERSFSVNGRPASLRRILLADGTIVHELWWQQGATSVMLRLGGPVDGVTRVADTILRNRP